MQLLSPAAKGLFAKAILQSGPCKVIARDKIDQRGVRYAEAGGCPSRGHAALDCLRQLPPANAALLSAGPVGLGDTAWQPVFGTSVIPKDARALRTGEFNRVPVINGSNRDEGRLFAIGAIALLPDEAAYRKNLDVQFGDKAPKVLAQYPIRNYDSIALAYAAYMTDWLFACPAYSATEAMARYTPVFAYEFSDASAPITLDVPKDIKRFGAFHTAEIQYVFQTPAPGFANPQAFTLAQKKLSDQMQAAWVNFARVSTPKLDKQRGWPPVQMGKMSILNFDAKGPRMAGDFSKYHRCEFWVNL